MTSNPKKLTVKKVASSEVDGLTEGDLAFYCRSCKTYRKFVDLSTSGVCIQCDRIAAHLNRSGFCPIDELKRRRSDCAKSIKAARAALTEMAKDIADMRSMPPEAFDMDEPGGSAFLHRWHCIDGQLSNLHTTLQNFENEWALMRLEDVPGIKIRFA